MPHAPFAVFRPSYVTLWLGLGCCLGLSGCGLDGERTSELRAVIDGPWTTICLSDAAAQASTAVELKLEGAQLIERRELYYSDMNCERLAAELILAGRYELEVTPREQIYLIDIRFESIKAALHQEGGRERLSTRLGCSTQDWPLDLSQELSAAAGGPCSALGALPQKNWNLLAIRRGQSLTFGAGMEPDNLRPEDVSFDDPTRSFVPQRLSLLRLLAWPLSKNL